MGFLTIFLWLIPIGSYSQDLRFTRLTQEDGISNGRHWARKTIIKDNFGIVWISTVDGFNRWDGYENEIFKNNIFDSTSIQSNFVTAVDQAPNGDLYIGTVAKGIIKYDYETGVFSDLGINKIFGGANSVHNVVCDKKGNVWMGIGRIGTHRYIIEKDTFEQVPLFKNHPRWPTNLNFSYGTILKDGTLLLSSQVGLHFYNEEQDSFDFISTLSHDLEWIEEAEDGKIWGSDRNVPDIFIIDRDTKNMEILDVPGMDMHNVAAIKRDHEGNMWYGKGHFPNERLSKYDIEKDEFIHYYHDPADPRTFSQTVVNSMVIDSLGNLWYMSTVNGAGYTQIDDVYFDKLLDYPVNNIILKNDSTLFLASEKNFQELNLNTSEIEVIFPKNEFKSYGPSLIDSDNNLWFFENLNLGLFKLNLETYELINLPAVYSGAMVEKDDIIWTANCLDFVNKKLLTCHSLNEIFKSKGQDTIPKSFTYALSSLKDGNLLLSSASLGMFLFNHKDTTFKHYDGKDFKLGKLSSPAIMNTVESEYSNLVYVATIENINIWNRDTDVFTYVNKADGLEGRPLSMIEDEYGALWVLTSMGLHKIIENKVVAQYSTEYGLIGMVDRIDPIMVRDKNGFIYFSTSNALYRFHPDRLAEMPPPQDVLIQYLYLNREKQNPITSPVLSKNLLFKPSLELSFKNRDIGFGYVSPFGKDRKVEYHYRLKGYDDKWVNNGLLRQVHFTSLKAGKYILQLKGKSCEGLWTGVSEYPFQIRPPWYATWWAYLLYAITICSIFYSIYRYRINQLLRYQNLRTKISSDLHDDVGTLLSSLAWQTDVIGMSVDEKAQEKFSKISSLSRTAMERMRDTVWAIDSRKDDIMSLMDRMTDFLVDHFEDRELNFKFEHDSFDEKNKIAPDIRQNVYLIFKEAVTNAIKHSNGTLVNVELRQSKRLLSLTVHDNGVVDSNTIKKSGLGLSNMKMRAERINAEIVQTWDDGCKVSLKVPI